MAMDADSFCSMVADTTCFEGTRGKWRKRALYLCAVNYRDAMHVYPDEGRAELTAIVRKQLKAEAKEEYGSAILIFVAMTILGAAISFAVSKFMAWLWPNKNAALPDPARVEMCRQIRKSFEQGQR